MNEDRELSEEQALRGRSGEVSREDLGMHGLTRGSAGAGQEALRELLRGTSGAANGAANGSGGPKGGVTKPGAAEPGATESGATAPVDEEQVLRDLLRGAVGGIEPSGDALERLRYAVPARRVRKRQLLIAAVAAAVLVGTGVPATLHLTAGGGDATDHSTLAGHGQKGANGQGSDPHLNGAGKHPQPGQSSGGQGAGATTSPPSTGFPGLVPPHVSPPPATSPLPGGTFSSGGVLLPPPAAPGVPGCNADQLGVSGGAQPPKADGKVYGSFKVTNVSTRGCTVIGPDTVTAAPATGPAPGAGGTEVAVLGHTTGDPATGLLPDPSVETPLMVLAPNAAYEVRFAWVPPRQSCPGTDASAGSRPPETGAVAYRSADTATGTGADADARRVQGPVPQTDPATPVPSGVSVSHTPDSAVPGGPTTQTTIPDACGGTVYRTGVIPVQGPAQ